MKNIIELVNCVINDFYYFSINGGPIEANFLPANDKILIISGENATGKSFVRRIFQAILNEEKIELIHLSQQGRSSTGIPKIFIYGDESYNSTGYLTSQIITNGINNCKKREKEHFILWDEPEIGLSDKYSGGVGVVIKNFVENLPNKTLGCIIITHSKFLVKQLLDLNPSFLRLGDKLNLIDWLNEKLEPLDILELQDRNRLMFRSIQNILNKGGKE